MRKPAFTAYYGTSQGHFEYFIRLSQDPQAMDKLQREPQHQQTWKACLNSSMTLRSFDWTLIWGLDFFISAEATMNNH